MKKSASPRRAELLLTTALIAMIAVPAAAQVIHSLPVLENSGGAAGGASVTSLSANTMLIGLPDSQPRTVIRWDSFDIGTNSSVSINGLYSGSARPALAVLNRVTGTDSSDILGSLTSEPNISVFLINSNGILFGPTSQVNVGSFYASTLNIVDADFLSSTLLFQGTPASSGAAVSTGITQQGGAQLQSTGGPLVLIGGFVNVGANAVVNGGAAGAPQDVGIIAGNSVRINVPASPSSRLSFTIFRPTPVPTSATLDAQISVHGQVSGRNVIAFMETPADALNALLLVAGSGSITATRDSSGNGGDIVLAAGARDANSAITNSPGGVENDGTLTASGNVVLSGEVASSSGVLFRPQFARNNGTITAAGSVGFDAIQSIANTNLITALGDVSLDSGGGISLSGTTEGLDVALNAGGSVSANIIRARDDIAIRAVGNVDARNLSSGVTVRGSGPSNSFGAADTLVGSGVDLTGSHDIDIGAAHLNAIQIAAHGAGSDIRIRTGVSGLLEFNDETSAYFLDDLDFFADGNIAINGTATGNDVTMVAGGSLSAGNVYALDDIVLRAGGQLSPGVVRSGQPLSGLGPVDEPGSADEEEDTTLVGHDIILNSPNMLLNEVTAPGPGSDITTGGAATSAFNNQAIDFTAGGSIDNGATITSGGFVYFTANGNITNRAAITAGSAMPQDTDVDVHFDAGGNINNSGAITTHDGVLFEAVNIVNSAAISDSLAIVPDGLLDIQFAATGDITNSGALTSGESIKLDGVNITNSGAITAGVNLTPSADHSIVIDGTGNVINSAALTGGDIIELDGVNITNSAAIASTGDVQLFARNNILDSSATRTGSISGRDIALSAAGSITAGTLAARDDIAIRAGGTVTTDSLTTGATINGNGPVDVFGSADNLLDSTLAGNDVDVGGTSIAAGFIRAPGAGSDIILRGPVTASRSDLDFFAGGNITINGAASGTDVAMNAGGALTVGNINARDDIALRSVGALTVGQLSAGVAPAVDTAGSADAMLGRTLAGHDISVAAPNVTVAAASALGTGSDLFLTATTGDLTVTNLAVGGDVTLDALRNVSIGSLGAPGNVSILADNLDIQTSLSGAQVTITNRAGGNGVTTLGDASATGAFTLTAAEINRITTPVLTIDSLGQNVLIGNLTLNNSAGSTRVNLLGTGRVDLIGQLSGSGNGRTLQLGGVLGNANAGSAATLASIIRIAPTSSAGGRIVFDGGTLDLRGAKIGVGLDDGFLTPLGLLAGGTPLSTSVVASDWVANPKSTLYGVPGGYANPTVISAGTLRVTYADYALFQNTAAPSASTPTGVNVGTLEIVSSGSSGQNSFGLFGTIRDTDGVGAALVVKPDQVSYANSRVNGCLIITGGGCGGGPSSLPIPFDVLNSAEASSSEAAASGVGVSALATQKLVATDEERSFDFESLVGTNNEGLLGALGAENPPVTDRCDASRKDQACPAGEKPHEQ